jgi:hypothetical protein
LLISNSLINTTKMKYTTAVASLLAAAAAAPTAIQPVARQAESSPYFGVIAQRSASPIHFQPMNARGGRFYLGGKGPSSYCPEEVVGPENCPAGNVTTFAGGNQTLSLGVVVPGGQQVYVAPDGALSYTQAHSAYIPPGSTVTGFSRTKAPNSDAFGYLNWEKGFIACPGAAEDGWQVYGNIANGTFSNDCLGFSAIASPGNAPGAWQY